MSSLNELSLLSLCLVHGLSVAVWLGVMLFNLIVNFPGMRARSRDAGDFAAMMSAQARRTGPWLYILVALTLLSGLGVAALRPDVPVSADPALLLAKVGLLAAMLAAHLWATFSVWPRIHFALEQEWPALFFKYQFTMVFSSLLGIAAMALSYGSRIAAA